MFSVRRFKGERGRGWVWVVVFRDMGFRGCMFVGWGWVCGWLGYNLNLDNVTVSNTNIIQ